LYLTAFFFFSRGVLWPEMEGKLSLSCNAGFAKTFLKWCGLFFSFQLFMRICGFQQSHTTGLVGKKKKTELQTQICVALAGVDFFLPFGISFVFA